MKTIYKEIINIIRENFSNGIRNDFIDARKVLRIYQGREKCTNENISCRVIADIIRTNGIENSGRFYFISPDDTTEIKRFFDKLLRKNSILYYSAVYERHTDFFVRQNIFSPDVLKKILRTTSNHFCSDEFCATTSKTNLDYELERTFKIADNSLSLMDLQEKFPYVPLKKIQSALANPKKYLKTVCGNYGSIAKIKFDFQEIIAAKQQIYDQIIAKGYAASDDFSLASNFALNSAFAERDLQNLIFEQFFAAEFAKQGNTFVSKFSVKKKSSTRSIRQLRVFISAQTELSVDKLFNAANDFGINNHDALEAACENMIRVEKNLFVNDSLINFDVRAVDDALTSFVQGKIIPLRSVTSFVGFPALQGYSWNLFLLESFLRKYSQKYFYDTSTANSSNVGAIYPKSMKFTGYLDVQSSVILQENIPLEKAAVENFLSAQGYRSRRLAKTTERVIARAHTMLAAKAL